MRARIETQGAWTTPVIETRGDRSKGSVIDGETGFLVKPNLVNELVGKYTLLFRTKMS